MCQRLYVRRTSAGEDVSENAALRDPTDDAQQKIISAQVNVPQRSEADADAQSQQGMDPQQQFIQVDRFDQVIIDVEMKTADLGLNVIPGADEEQRGRFCRCGGCSPQIHSRQFPAS